MTITRPLRVLAIVLVMTSPALAEDISKELCIDSHSRGQDAREQNKLSLARKLFLTCAQPSCPALVQGDCARMADDLSRVQPSISFAARDASGVDLPDTSVFVDDVLVATRLDDGKAHDVDPGRHKVKFVHAGKAQLVTVVVGTGERGRTITATFGEAKQLAAPSPATPVISAAGNPPPPTPKQPKRAFGAKLLIGTGTALVIGGAALGFVGMSQIPANCSLSTHQCAAPPGDPSFDQASSAVQRTNMGFILTGVGVATTVGGILWYVKSGNRVERREERMVTPWITPSGAGIALSGRL